MEMKYVCNEPFWKFQKLDEKVSFCKVCKKNIVDFRESSIDEIKNYKALNPDLTCGIYSMEQAGISEKTIFGLSVYRLVAASVLTFLTIPVSESFAQTTLKDSIKVEQTEFTKSDSINNSPIPKVESINNEIESNKTVKKKTLSNSETLLRIGRFYIKSRFPFFYIKGNYWVGTPAHFW